jgi:lipopolysaccharide biosynthesis protein
VKISAKPARLIAFYLPQFYPNPENDSWWGKGFTEWTNVVRAKSLFAGHYQPRLPGHLGFYDLRVPEVREAQAKLAAAHGVEGFCYWHYWFQGKRLLDRPFNEVLGSGRPDFPFCLGWANETWQRRWHGSGDSPETLIEQTYSEEDDLNHIRWLIKAFADPRYIRVQGRPVFLIYRPWDLPDPRKTIDTFRAECSRHKLPYPYLIGLNAHAPKKDTRQVGFDATLNFEPQLGVMPGSHDAGLKIYDYPIARQTMGAQKPDYFTHPCILVSWDNTARRGQNGITFLNATPENFERGLAEVVNSISDRDPEQRLVFINAWNEWAEGNHLEPDLKYGLQWLEAVKRVSDAQTLS